MMSYKNGFKQFAVVGLFLLMTISPVRCGNEFVFGFQKVSASESDAETESNMEDTDLSRSDNGNEDTDAATVSVSDDAQSEEESIMKDVQEAVEDPADIYEEKNDNLTLTQRNSINMLNYMSALTQRINNSSGNQMYLEEVYSSLVNDIYPNAVDTKTQAQITDLMDTIENYRMITAKRERLEYLYEQNRAQALRQAIPNPVGLLSAIQSGSMLKSAVSILYMTVDSASSYKAASLQEDLQYQQEDWDLRYFAAQIYMDLYSLTKNEAYLNSAYEIAFNNVNVLVDEQRTLNTTYMEEVHKVKSDKKASKRKKKEVKKYNKLLEAERKVALPPVSESLYLNADLLFALAEKIDISEEEQSRIEAILHENGDNLFLTQMLDNRFWFGSAPEEVSAEEIEISFDKGKLTIPATCVTDRSSIEVMYLCYWKKKSSFSQPLIKYPNFPHQWCVGS